MNNAAFSILMVDDDPLMTELFSEILSADFDVLIAHNINEAQQLCCHNKIAVVLSDYHIGLQTADILFDWLKHTQPQLIKTFILLTGDQVTDLSSYEEAAAVLYKPVSIDALLSIVARVYQGGLYDKMEA